MYVADNLSRMQVAGIDLQRELTSVTWKKKSMLRMQFVCLFNFYEEKQQGLFLFHEFMFS